MIYRPFGKTGWRVSQIGVGCWQFGGAITLDGKPDGWPGINDNDSIAVVRRALELGINFFDTADMYGWGHSEEVLGRALKDGLTAVGGRDRVYIASKVGFWHDDNGQRTLNESRDYIIAACDASLRRLQLTHLDLYQCHLWRTERWPEFLDAFERLQKAGKIRQYGVSTNDLDMVQRFDDRQGLAAVQANYNLLDHRAETALLPYCRARGIAFIARGPLAMGKLGGRMTANTKFDANDIRIKWLDPANREAFERDMTIVDRLRPIAGKNGYTLAQFALKYVLTHVAVSITIAGTKTRTQLEDSVSSTFLPPLTTDELAATAAARQID
jgi:aryl-alcohol dehydrogenase-like predicted oxidoreductase